VRISIGFLLSFLLIFIDAPLAQSEGIAVQGDKVHTVSDLRTIDNGIVLIRDGKIEMVGPAIEIEIPDGYETLKAARVTPGLIDAHSLVGVSGIYNVDADSDHNEDTGPNQASLRVIDGFNPTEPLLEYILRFGVTCIHTGPGENNPIAGQMAVFKTSGKTMDASLVKSPSALLINLGESPKSTYGGRNQSPSTRMGTAAVIRQAFIEAQIYQEKWEKYEAKKTDEEGKEKSPPDRDLNKEALMKALKKEIPVVINADREDDILTGIRIANEFNLDLILDGASEGYLTADRIKESGAPVFVHPTMQRIGGLETYNTSLENAALLANKGIPIAIQSGYESYVPKTHLILFEAAIAMVNGLGFDRALEAITISPARILKIEDRVGSIEAGKDADLVLFNGDPFEYATHVDAVLVDGEVVYRLP